MRFSRLISFFNCSSPGLPAVFQNEFACAILNNAVIPPNCWFVVNTFIFRNTPLT